MFKLFLDKIANIDSSIFKVIKKGVFFSLSICFFAIILLQFSNTYNLSHIAFESGIILFKTGLMFVVEFFICGIAIDTIKKQFN